MPMEFVQLRRGQSRAISLWFIFDAVVALAPPLYWAADANTRPILSIPIALLYFLAVGACITGSVIAAYFDDRARGEVS
jgi:hypothetical protein